MKKIIDILAEPDSPPAEPVTTWDCITVGLNPDSAIKCWPRKTDGEKIVLDWRSRNGIDLLPSTSINLSNAIDAALAAKASSGRAPAPVPPEPVKTRGQIVAEDLITEDDGMVSLAIPGSSLTFDSIQFGVMHGSNFTPVMLSKTTLNDLRRLFGRIIDAERAAMKEECARAVDKEYGTGCSGGAVVRALK